MSADTERQVTTRVRGLAQGFGPSNAPTNVHRLPTAAPAPVLQPQRRIAHSKGVTPINSARARLNRAKLQSRPVVWLDLVPPVAQRALSAQEVALVDAAKAALARNLATHRGPLLNSASAVRDLCYLHLASLDHERFAVAFLDAQLTLLSFDEMFSGSLTHTTVHPREVVRRALALNAAAVIVAHNHPSGRVEPSKSDHEVTRTLQAALSLVDVRVIDHVIVGGDGSMSFAERGLI